jgi:hypothetical protein
MIGAGEKKAVIHYDGTLRYSETVNVLVRGGDWNCEWNPVLGTWDYLYTSNGVRINKYAMTIFRGIV